MMASAQGKKADIVSDVTGSLLHRHGNGNGHYTRACMRRRKAHTVMMTHGTERGAREGPHTSQASSASTETASEACPKVRRSTEERRTSDARRSHDAEHGRARTGQERRIEIGKLGALGADHGGGASLRIDKRWRGGE